MNEDEPFLRAILDRPDDPLTRLVYADWLDDRSDPRAEYLRLVHRVAELPIGHCDRSELRQRMLALQPHVPSWWAAIVGGLRATSDEPLPTRVEEVARTLGRPVSYTDGDGYELSVTAAALNGLTGAVAYLESRAKWRDKFFDIRYQLHLRAPSGQSTSCEPRTYNPYFGCDVQFLEWYGDTVVMIYQEKHGVYVCHFGFDRPALFSSIGYRWVVDGQELGHQKYGQGDVSRLSVPDLKVLEPLSCTEARERDLMPG